MRSLFSNDLLFKNSSFNKIKSFLLNIKDGINSHLNNLALTSYFTEERSNLAKAESIKYYDEKGTCYSNIKKIENDILNLKGQTTARTNNKNHSQL